MSHLMTDEEIEEKFKIWTEKHWSGKKLLENHTLDEYGVWQIRGADPNVNLGGYHHQPHQPDLGLHEGILEDVIRVAINMGGVFWGWGGEGSIKKYSSPKINKVDDCSVERRRKLLKKKEELEAEIAKINKTLGKD